MLRLSRSHLKTFWGGAPPPFINLAMAQQPRFDVEDIERLFRALLPAGREDPFGRLEELLVELGKALVEGDEETDTFREKLLDELASIKTRTFGILLLQIFQTLRFFFGLLPSGRLILLTVAAIGLVQTLLSTDKPSLQDIRDAVESTGVAKFIDKILAEIQTVADELGDTVSSAADVTSQMFVAMAGRMEGTEATIESAILSLQQIGEISVNTPEGLFEAQRTAATAATALLDALPGTTEATTLAINGVELIGPLLRGLDGEIRKFPDLAVKLVRL